jgi:hypothetical protein
MSKLELRKGFDAVSKLKISIKKPLATSGEDDENCPMSPPGCKNTQKMRTNYNNLLEY